MRFEHVCSGIMPILSSLKAFSIVIAFGMVTKEEPMFIEKSSKNTLSSVD